MDETEDIRADELSPGNTLKHPKTGEWVGVAEVRPAGQGEKHPDSEVKAMKREWNSVDVRLDTGEWLLFRTDDQVTRKRS